MVITETWLNGDDRDKRTISDISNTLIGYDIVHVRRKCRHGGGVASIVRKVFIIAKNSTSNYKEMACLDINVNFGNRSLRLISVYRPPPSSKKKLTHSMFFDDFSCLIEDLSFLKVPALLLVISIYTWKLVTKMLRFLRIYSILQLSNSMSIP